MKKTIYLIEMVLVVSLLILVVLGARQAVNPFTYKKLMKSTEIPSIVQEELNKVEFERGLYYFSCNFTKGDSYLVVCGGEDYSEGYDIIIDSYKYVSMVDSYVPNSSAREQVSGFYDLYVIEKQSTNTYEYSKNAKYPFVVFKISGNAEYYWVNVSNNETLNINRWWSGEQMIMETKDWRCEVVQNKEDLPKYINELQNIKWANTKEIRPFTNSSECDTASILIVGEEGEPPFGVSIEAVNWRYGPEKRRNFDIVIRKQYSKDPALEYNSIPYSLIRLKINKNYDYISFKNIIIIDDFLNWEHLRY